MKYNYKVKELPAPIGRKVPAKYGQKYYGIFGIEITSDQGVCYDGEEGGLNHARGVIVWLCGWQYQNLKVAILVFDDYALSFISLPGFLMHMHFVLLIMTHGLLHFCIFALTYVCFVLLSCGSPETIDTVVLYLFIKIKVYLKNKT